MGWCLSVLVVLPHQKASPPLSRHFRFSRDPSAALQRHGAIFARDELWQSLHFDVAAQSLKVDRGEIPLIFMLYTSVYMCILYIIYVPTKKKTWYLCPVSVMNIYGYSHVKFQISFLWCSTRSWWYLLDPFRPWDDFFGGRKPFGKTSVTWDFGPFEMRRNWE